MQTSTRNDDELEERAETRKFAPGSALSSCVDDRWLANDQNENEHEYIREQVSCIPGSCVLGYSHAERASPPTSVIFERCLQYAWIFCSVRWSFYDVVGLSATWYGVPYLVYRTKLFIFLVYYFVPGGPFVRRFLLLHPNHITTSTTSKSTHNTRQQQQQQPPRPHRRACSLALSIIISLWL